MLYRINVNSDLYSNNNRKKKRFQPPNKRGKEVMLPLLERLQIFSLLMLSQIR